MPRVTPIKDGLQTQMGSGLTKHPIPQLNCYWQLMASGEGRTCFSSGWNPVWSHVCSSRWSYISTHSGRTNWTRGRGVKKEFMNLGGEMMRRMWRNWMKKWGWFIKMCYIDVYMKNQIIKIHRLSLFGLLLEVKLFQEWCWIPLITAFRRQISASWSPAWPLKWVPDIQRYILRLSQKQQQWRFL